MARVKIAEFNARIVNIFKKAGVSEEDAAVLAEVLTDSQMKGILTHGYLRVKRYFDCVKSGGISPKCEVNIISDSPSWACVDGGGGLGIVIAKKATDIAIEKAKTTGVGIVNVKNSHHLGAVGFYAEKCADEKMFSMAMSNGDVLIAATGSKEKNIGNNPFAYCVPAGKYGKILYDVAISVGSDMKIIQMEKEKKLVPDGWMIDKDGKPSNNPSDYLAGGVLLPFGGYKGYGLALMVESFAAILSGSAVTKNVHAWNTTPKTSGDVGHFIMALDISKMGDACDYEKRVESIIDEIKASPLADGADKIYYPGEKELTARKECLETGEVFVQDDVLAEIEELEKNI